MQLPKPENQNAEKIEIFFTIKQIGKKKHIEVQRKRKGCSLTRVQGSDSSIVVEIAAIIGHAMLEEIVIESIRRRILHTAGVVAGPTLLDWAAISSAGAAGPIQRRQQCRVLRVVLRHAPQLLPGNAAAAGGPTKRREGQKKEEKKARRNNEAFSSGHCWRNWLGLICGYEWKLGEDEWVTGIVTVEMLPFNTVLQVRNRSTERKREREIVVFVLECIE